MNHTPRHNIKYGTILFNLFRTDKLMSPELTEARNISGSVPKPKKAMYWPEFKTELVFNAPTNARYTKPQGKKPFSIPTNK